MRKQVDAFVTAHENLLRVIPKPLTAEEEAERTRTGRELPDVDPEVLYDVARCFVDALPAAAEAELKRRGTLCATLTGQGSEYSIAKENARRALPDWNLAAQFAEHAVYLNFLQRRVRQLLQEVAAEELVAEVQDKRESVEYLLALNEMPEATRPLLEAWRDAAWSVVSQGKNGAWDGCYWLLHTENLRSKLFTIYAPAIRQAVNALVGWYDAQSTDASPKGQGGVDDPSSWVPANTLLWRDRFSNNNELTKFRGQHPEMFRNPSKFKLEIHAALWARYWANRDKAGFAALDGDLPSVADDPTAREDTLIAAAQRVAQCRAKKKAGKQ